MIAAFKPTEEKNGGEIEMAVYVGIDVHKKYCQAALMNDQGHVLKELRFDNTSKGASTLLDLARSLDPHVKAVVESSANFWIRVYDKLEEKGVDVKLSRPDDTTQGCESSTNESNADMDPVKPWWQSHTR